MTQEKNIGFNELNPSLTEVVQKYKGEKIEFEFELKNGVVSDFNEDTHYGSVILTDKETTTIVDGIREYIPNDVVGWVSIDIPNESIKIEY